METVNHECYVSLEVAKLLKQAGFDWECIRYYQNNNDTLLGPLVDQYKLVCTNFNVAPVYMNQYSAPTLEVAQRWLREFHKVHILIDCIAMKRWEITLQYFNGNDVKIEDNEFTYEQAQEAGIKKALEIILETEE